MSALEMRVLAHIFGFVMKKNELPLSVIYESQEILK